MNDLFGVSDDTVSAKEDDRPPVGEIARDDPMPPGPYSVGLVKTPSGTDSWPYTIRCGDGRAVAGHVTSLACAKAIVEALNRP